MRLRYCVQMRCVNYQFASVLNDGTEFITRFSANPQFIIVFVKKRDDALVLAIGVSDVDLTTNCSCASESLTDISCK